MGSSFNIAFISFARCQRCLCDSAGSINNTCDVNTGQCPCKQYTTSQSCGQCVPGTSSLSPSNPYGCSRGIYNSFTIQINLELKFVSVYLIGQCCYNHTYDQLTTTCCQVRSLCHLIKLQWKINFNVSCLISVKFWVRLYFEQIHFQHLTSFW